jgi:Bacteriophage clamp loader A subunit
MAYDWRYENSINFTKDYQDPDNNEYKYSAWRTNSSLSYFPDTVLYANEMNMLHHLDDKLQYDYLFFSIRQKKRFFKKDKKHEKDHNHDLVQGHYKYNNERTRESLKLLTDEQLDIIRKKEEKGGT